MVLRCYQSVFSRFFFALLCCVLLSGQNVCVSAPAKESSASDNNPELKVDLIPKAIELIQKTHVEKVPEHKLVEAALNGMLQSLDAHGGYITPKAMQAMRESVKGSFGGLGIEVTMEHGFVKVITALDQSPAHKAGIDAGDYITHIDKELVLGMTFDQAVEKMRGPLDSVVSLTIKREGRNFFDVSLKRSEIKYQPVRYHVHDHVAYIRVATFLNAQTTQMVRDAVKSVQKAGSPLEGIILDLRNNPGGLLTEAVQVSDLFLNGGEIVSTRGQDPKHNEHYKSSSHDMTEGLPLVVLINAGSASAAEIVAGALQDHQRAVLLGTTSFGKGSVQSVVPLPQSLGAFSITTARYYTPSGRCIQAKGIEPDIFVEQAIVENISDAERRREKDIPLALKPDDFIQVIKRDLKKDSLQKSAEGHRRDQGYGPLKKTTPEKEDERIPRAFREPPPIPKADTFLKSQPDLEKDKEKDYQLARAFDLIKGLKVVRNKQSSRQASLSLNH